MNNPILTWIDSSIERIERNFMNSEQQAVMKVVGPKEEFIDHFDGRQLNPGHAIECAWFIMHEGKLRKDQRLITLGLTALDWMWARGWDEEFGGIFTFAITSNVVVQLAFARRQITSNEMSRFHH